MGWDAFAVYEDGESIRYYESVVGLVIDDEISEDFLNADLAVRTACTVADGGLSQGWLNSSLCGEAFNTLYDIDAWPPGERGEYDLSPEKVKKLAQEDDDIVKWLQRSTADTPANEWHLYSVLAFVRVCAKHDLAIKFSY